MNSTAARSPSLYTISPLLLKMPSYTIHDFSPPSPYIVNTKRRDNHPVTVEDSVTTVVNKDDADGVVAVNEEEKEEDDDEVGFYDPRETMSVASSNYSDFEDDTATGLKVCRGCREESSVAASEQSYYYDAADDLFSDGSVSNSSPPIVTEVKSLKLCLMEEAEKREKAEKDLHLMQFQWHKVAEGLSQVGLSSQLDPDAIYRDIMVTRIVFETFERELARAETEVVMEEIIESKNNEISRLRDRLQYYEAVNHEMSHRNQEAVEFSRQERLRRKAKRRIIWGCVGLSITIGASLLTYSKFPMHGSDASGPTTSISTDTQDCCQ